MTTMRLGVAKGCEVGPYWSNAGNSVSKISCRVTRAVSYPAITRTASKLHSCKHAGTLRCGVASTHELVIYKQSDFTCFWLGVSFHFSALFTFCCLSGFGVRLCTSHLFSTGKH